MNDDKKKIIERIKKILALARNNPNEHEAESAAQMAARMIQKFNIDNADLITEELGDADTLIHKEVYCSEFNSDLESWVLDLVEALRIRFNVVPLVSKQIKRRKPTTWDDDEFVVVSNGRKTEEVPQYGHIFVLFLSGYDLDVHAAAEVFTLVKETINDWGPKAYQRLLSTQKEDESSLTPFQIQQIDRIRIDASAVGEARAYAKFVASYAKGLVERLALRFKEMARYETQHSYGTLVSVKEAKILARFNPSGRTMKCGGRDTIDSSVAARGYFDGGRMELTRGVG